MRWLYLHFPSLLLDHYAMTAPELPLAVSAGTPPAILQANAIARNAGVQPGQALATARALRAQLHLIPDNPKREQAYLREVAASIYPLAAPVFPWKPDGLLVDARALKRLHGSPWQLERHLLEHIRQRALQVQSAIGETPRMARILARWAPDCSQQPGQCADQILARLPVTATDWPESVKERLQRMGLKTLGQLFNYCPSELTRRLGPEVTRELQYLRGERREALDEFLPPPFFKQHLELLQETAHAEALRFPLQRLLQELESFLRQRQHATDCLLIRLKKTSGETTRLDVRLSKAEHRAEAFMPLVALHLEQLQLDDEVKAISLRVTRLLPLAAPATDLFGTPQQTHEEVAALLSRLRARLGEKQVHQVQCRADHRPERAWQRLDTPASTSMPASFPLRPLWLLHHPQPVSTAAQRWLAGPERIQGGWWDGDYVRRDYYIAELPQGRRAWLYRNAEGQWFVHGWFG